MEDNTMGEYVKKKSDMKFQNQEALQQVQRVIDDADATLKDKLRRIKDSPIGEAVTGAAGIAAGAGIGFTGLYFGGAVVGLSAAGITSGLAAVGVLGAPVVALGVGAVGITSHIKNKKLRESKEILYKNALSKQTAILKALKEESNADKERIEYLNGLNVLLQAAIKDLQHDLGIALQRGELHEQI